MGPDRIIPRCLLEALPMTEVDATSQRARQAHAYRQSPLFRDKSTLEYSPADKRLKEERTDEERTDVKTALNSQPSQPVQISQPLVVNLLPAAPPASSPSRPSPPVPLVVYSSLPIEQVPSSSASPPTRRRIPFGSPPTVMRLEPQSPVPISVEATKVLSLYQRFDKAHGYGKRKRGDRRPKVYSVSLKPETSENIRCLYVNKFTDVVAPDDALFVYMGAHEDTRDFTATQITLEAALKTKYKTQVEDPAVVECKDISSFETFKYLMRREDAEKAVHTALLLPCSIVVKDTCDSKGELQPWKNRLATGGLMTNPKTYQPFGKTSLTASIMDSAYSALGSKRKCVTFRPPILIRRYSRVRSSSL